MAQDVAVQENKPSGACCATLQKKHSKLLEKCAKLEEIKNKFRVCTELVQKKYDEVEKDNGSLRKALEELKLQVDFWKDEKDKVDGRCTDLEDEVSALQDEVQLLKQTSGSASHGVDEQLQERIAQSEEEIKQLNKFLDQERGKVASGKKSAELEKKKADEALKKLEKGRNQICELQKAAIVDRKNAEEYKLMWEKLQKETDDMKSMLALEKSRSEDAEKKLEAEKQKSICETKRADMAVAKSEELQKLTETSLEKDRADELNQKLEQARNRVEQLEGELLKHKCSEKSEDKLLLEKFKKETDDLKAMLALEKSKSEAAQKKVEVEIQKANEERKKAKLAVDKSKEKNKLAETNLKKAMSEKTRADDLNQKLEQARNRVGQLEGELLKHKCSEKSEDKLLLEKFKKETDDLKSMLAFEKSKSEAAQKKVEVEKQKTTEERKRAKLAVDKSKEQNKLAETNLKRAMSEKTRADDLNQKLEQARNKVEQLEGELIKNKCSEKSEDRLLLEKFKKETDDLKSMLALEKSISEAAHKKVQVEKQRATEERKRAKLAADKSKEQQKLSEMNLKRAMSEKTRADDLNQKLEEAKNRVDKSNPGRNAVLATDARTEMLKHGTQFSKWVEKMLLEKDHTIIREKKRADSAKKRAKKQRKVAEEHKKMSMEQKHRADQLSVQLENYKLRLEGLQKKMQEFISRRNYADISPITNNDIIFETDTVGLLKNQLELEKLLVKHAKQATKIEAFRNKVLEQELCRLKQESLKFQQHLNKLDKSFLNGSGGIDQLKKIGGQTTEREILGIDGDHRRLMSGIDSRMDPPYRGSNQKILQGSALYSSSASFSDRPLVGSQERDTLSIMTSANLGEDVANFTPKIFDEMQNKQNVSKADNRSRTPLKDSSSKRRAVLREKKRILGAAKPVENLYVTGEKLQQQMSEKLPLLHDIRNDQMDEPREESLKGTLTELFRPLKKRKTSSEGTVIIHHLQDSGQSKGIPDSNINNSDACIPASSPGSDAVRSDLVLRDGTNNILGHNLPTPDFDQMVTGDYMKLLEMDNAADEESYCRAIARPLSPTLPGVEVVSSEMLVCRSSQEGLPNVSSYTVIETEKNLTSVVSNGSVPSLLQTEHNSVDFLKDTTPLAASDTHYQEIHVSSRKLGMPYLSGSGNKVTIESCENGSASSCGETPKFLILSSDNKNISSILRILQTICSCMPQCSFDHSVEMFIQNVIHILSKVKDLSTREKACVFLSLILPEISELGLKNLTNGLGGNFVQAVGSVSILFNSALSDPSLRRMAMESCGFLELLAIIENFLHQSRVFVYGGVSAESEFHVSSKLNLILNDNHIMLLEVAASAHLLVAGGSLLASLCSAVDDIGYVCEISYSIIRMQKLDRPVMLAILHVFALICGSKYFTLQQYSVAMSVVKSVVMFLEEQTVSANSISLSQSDVRNPSSMLVCTHCPFSAGAVSVEDAAVMLLENLQKQCRCGLWPQDSLSLVNLLFPTLPLHEEGGKEVSGSGEVALSSLACDENSCNFLDIISLFELLASVMNWDWTSDHLIGQICEYLELHLTEGFSAAIIILLGQLGRIGAGAAGYEDPGVRKLRDWFSKFAQEITFKRLSIFVQAALITSLLGVTPIKFEEIAEGKTETPAAVSSQSIPYSFVREWFSSLSHEQQSLVRIHLTASEGKQQIVLVQT
ncbi:myosin-10-like [Salvia divinorum]|uniref:Myosin-10-like n=1 Tax=Salvia divinorum TaxID=28513 RepID=A0ABD1HV98_SALDI